MSTLTFSEWDLARTRNLTAGRRLRRLRTLHSITLTELAASCGTNAAHLSRIEHGESVPSPELHAALVARLQSLHGVCVAVPVPESQFARISDPVSSQHAVADMAADTGTRELVEAAIGHYADVAFTDSDLVRCLAQSGTPKPRNVVAKYRGWIEEAGMVERVGVYRSVRWNRQLTHFVTVR